MRTVSINEENYIKLLNLAGRLQAKRDKRVSVNDVVTRLLITEKVLIEAGY